MRSNNLNFRINYQIRAPKVRVIGADGKQLDVMELKEALAESQKQGLDLVEIAPNANPPVAKIVNIGKFRYEQEKKQKQLNKKSRPAELKEVRLSPFIADHDFSNRLDKISEFLKGKHKVRVVVVFTGRQMGSRDFGFKVLDRVLEVLGDKITVDMKPKFIGKHLMMIISPTTSRKKLVVT